MKIFRGLFTVVYLERCQHLKFSFLRKVDGFYYFRKKFHLRCFTGWSAGSLTKNLYCVTASYWQMAILNIPLFKVRSDTSLLVTHNGITPQATSFSSWGGFSIRSYTSTNKIDQRNSCTERKYPCIKENLGAIY